MAGISGGAYVSSCEILIQGAEFWKGGSTWVVKDLFASQADSEATMLVLAGQWSIKYQLNSSFDLKALQLIHCI